MHPERDDAADQLRRQEVGELRGKRCNAGREVGALVVCDAARVDHALQVELAIPGSIQGVRELGAST